MPTASSNPDKCWIIIYADEDFKGKHEHLFGPARYPNMRINGEDWHDEIDSVKIGPCAYVRCYEDELFESTHLWLLPGQEIARLNDFGFGDRIDSIEIFSDPPKVGERGYEEYLKAEADRNKGVGE